MLYRPARESDVGSVSMMFLESLNTIGLRKKTVLSWVGGGVASRLGITMSMVFRDAGYKGRT